MCILAGEFRDDQSFKCQHKRYFILHIFRFKMYTGTRSLVLFSGFSTHLVSLILIQKNKINPNTGFDCLFFLYFVYADNNNDAERTFSGYYYFYCFFIKAFFFKTFCIQPIQELTTAAVIKRTHCWQFKINRRYSTQHCSTCNPYFFSVWCAFSYFLAHEHNPIKL